MIMIDVLHCLDLGVSQSLLGMLFWEFWLSSLSEGSNRAKKTEHLWRLIKQYYAKMQPPTRISALTVEMIKQPSKGPRFRGKGAETRHMVPFSVDLSQMMSENVGGTSAHYNQLIDLCRHLVAFYMTFGMQPYDVKAASRHARSFCLLYASFNAKTDDPLFWRIKPKFHLFIHLAEMQCFESGDPSRFWCYKDEDFVGIIAQYAGARGGKRIPSTTPRNVIDNYRGLA